MRARFYLRLEPTRPGGDPQRGFAAELADPAWMLGRQWQMGEHQGENASSPLSVALTLRHFPLKPMRTRPKQDPHKVPAEAIVEGNGDDWWTVGRRARLGLAAEQAGLVNGLSERRRAQLRFHNLTGPYERLNGSAYDGQKIHKLRPRHAVFAEVPAANRPHWRTDMLAYMGRFPCGGTQLAVGGVDGGVGGRWGGHDGGDVDWWSVDSAGALSARGPQPQKLKRWPDRFRWPGAPAPRWWQIEDQQVDLGCMPPDRAHVATMMLLDLICGHADDWFLVPISTDVGTTVRIESVKITDSFGDTWPKRNGPTWPVHTDWAMFQVTGLTARELAVWPTAAAALVGEAIDEVTLGVDEDANLVWAVEERLHGKLTARQLPVREPIQVAEDSEPPAPTPLFRYTPATAVPDHWYPYTREEQDGTIRFVQGRLVSVDLEGDPSPAPVPTSSLLNSMDARPHAVAPWRLPPTGVRLETRPVLARTTEGAPVFWIQRRRRPLLATPASGLRFDALVPTSD